jgi:hypothetical protein
MFWKQVWKKRKRLQQNKMANQNYFKNESYLLSMFCQTILSHCMFWSFNLMNSQDVSVSINFWKMKWQNNFFSEKLKTRKIGMKEFFYPNLEKCLNSVHTAKKSKFFFFWPANKNPLLKCLSIFLYLHV